MSPEFPPIIALFLMGFLGSGAHCIFMCSPIMAALTLNSKRRSSLIVAYNLGRIVTYTLLGVLFGALGHWLALRTGSLFQAQRILTLLAVLFMLLIALQISGLYAALAPLEALGGRFWRQLEPVARRLMPVNHWPNALLLGSVWGFVPCGMVYSALATSLAAGGAAEGGAIMLAFGLGTLPALLAIGLVTDSLNRWLQQTWLKRLAGVLIAAMAIWMLAQQLFKTPPVIEHGNSSAPPQHQPMMHH